MLKKIILAMIIAQTMVFAQTGGTGKRYIESIGCHKFDSTCYVWISGDPVGKDECSNKSVRWSTDDENGKQILSLLTSAYLSGKRAMFEISRCYPNQNEFPTFSHMKLFKD